MSEVVVQRTQDSSVHIFSRVESREGEMNMSLTWCAVRDPNDDREHDVPPRHNEPDPDEPEPDDETNDLVRPIKT
jgi:hypothetical protein